MNHTIVHGMTIKCHLLQDASGKENETENIARLRRVVAPVEKAVELPQVAAAAVRAVRFAVPVIRVLRPVAQATAANTVIPLLRRFEDLPIQTISLDQHHHQVHHRVVKQVPVIVGLAAAPPAPEAAVHNNNNRQTMQLFHRKLRRTIAICVKNSNRTNTVVIFIHNNKSSNIIIIT